MKKFTLELSDFFELSGRVRKIYVIIGAIAVITMLPALIFYLITQGFGYLGFSLVFNIILGFYFLLLGLGKFPKKLSGYYSFDEEKLEYKTSAFRKREIILWKDIQKITIKPTAINFYLENNESREISLGLISYRYVRAIKKYIQETAALKKVGVQ
ncbi:hypothetical protein ES705_22296 [subsurface metagenome]